MLATWSFPFHCQGVINHLWQQLTSTPLCSKPPWWKEYIRPKNAGDKKLAGRSSCQWKWLQRKFRLILETEILLPINHWIQCNWKSQETHRQEWSLKTITHLNWTVSLQRLALLFLILSFPHVHVIFPFPHLFDSGFSHVTCFGQKNVVENDSDTVLSSGLYRFSKFPPAPHAFGHHYGRIMLWIT